jgi:hypothetical protein
MSTTQQLATLRNRQTALLHDLASRGKPKTPAEHQVCMEIARELDAIQGEMPLENDTDDDPDWME